MYYTFGAPKVSCNTEITQDKNERIFFSRHKYQKLAMLLSTIYSRCNSLHPKTKKLTAILPLILLSATTTKFTLTRAMSSSTATTNMPTKSAALIFLHGLGDSPAGWSSLEDQLPSIEPSLSDVKYVFPAAPTIPLTINGGMTMPGWFDLYDWPIGVGVKDDDDGLAKAVDVVEECVAQLESEGFTRDRIAVGGFSQGGAVALRTAYYGGGSKQDTNSGFAACVSLSGWVTFKEVPSNDGVKGTPLFLGHGSQDDKVLFEQQQHAEITLSSQGVKNIESKSYRMGHSSHPKEMMDMAQFLHKILFETTN